MTIMESAIEMNNSYVECTNSLNRIGLFSEASHKEYEINLKEIALKVLKENGTEEDFDFLATEAAKDYIKRTRKAIEKCSAAVTKFNTKCKADLLKMVNKDKTKKALEKLEESCNANSKLGNTKVDFNDTDKQVKLLTETLDKIRKRVSKVKAKGVATEDDVKFITEIDSELDGKVNAVPTKTTITLSAAVSKISAMSSKTEIDTVISEDISDLEVGIDESNTHTPETADFFVRATNTMGKIKKEISTKKVAKITSLISSVTTAVKSLKKETVATESEMKLEDLKMFAYVTESVEPETTEEVATETEEVVEEATDNLCEGLDLDAYFESVCKEVFESAEEETTEVTEPVEEPTEEPVEEHVEESTEDLSQTYLEQMEAELFGNEEEVVEESSEETEIDAETYLEQMEAELFGEDEEVVEESTETTETDIDDSIQSLLDEMESLL